MRPKDEDQQSGEFNGAGQAGAIATNDEFQERENSLDTNLNAGRRLRYSARRFASVQQETTSFNLPTTNKRRRTTTTPSSTNTNTTTTTNLSSTINTTDQFNQQTTAINNNNNSTDDETTDDENQDDLCLTSTNVFVNNNNAIVNRVNKRTRVVKIEQLNEDEIIENNNLLNEQQVDNESREAKATNERKKELENNTLNRNNEFNFESFDLSNSNECSSSRWQEVKIEKTTDKDKDKSKEKSFNFAGSEQNKGETRDKILLNQAPSSTNVAPVTFAAPRCKRKQANPQRRKNGKFFYV